MKNIFKIVAQIIGDISICILSIYVSFYLVYGTHFIWPEFHTDAFRYYIFIALVTMLAINFVFGVYKVKWEYASIREMLRVTIDLLVFYVVLFTISRTCVDRVHFIPVRVFLIFAVVYSMFYMMFKISVRVLMYVQAEHKRRTGKQDGRILILGAGEVGRLLLFELKKMNQRGHVVGFLDDDKDNRHISIDGVRVYGSIDHVVKTVEKLEIDEIIIAMPSVNQSRIKEILNLCTQTKCRIQIIPPVGDMVNGRNYAAQLRDVQPEDLLGREPVQLDIEAISAYLSNKTVLVTGAGGSIGSELCRQIAKYSPRLIILLDIYENSIYELEYELKREYSDIKIQTLIASVRDIKRLDDIFKSYRPQIVYHAAAHKHVPLMEDSPCEAVKNNVFGTKNVTNIASKYNVERFVLISTDKAVNPTNIMGTTKRIAEYIVGCMNKISDTEFVAVRFGNVLGSNGSVIPLFKKQIEVGGPVTVTHPNITRYFMTIPEAAQLVLQAGGLAGKGNIFVLDMGEMVKIDDLAKNLIKLSGLVPGEDIEIVYTGLRPGEKMYEELLTGNENLIQTEYKKIFIGENEDYDIKYVFNKLDELKSLLDCEEQDVIGLLHEMVPEFRREKEYALEDNEGIA